MKNTPLTLALALLATCALTANAQTETPDQAAGATDPVTSGNNILPFPDFGEIYEKSGKGLLDHWNVAPGMTPDGQAKFGQFSIEKDGVTGTVAKMEFTEKGTLSMHPKSHVTINPSTKYRVSWKVRGEGSLKAETLVLEMDHEKNKTRQPAGKTEVTSEWTTQSVEWVSTDLGQSATFTIKVHNTGQEATVWVTDPRLEELAQP